MESKNRNSSLQAIFEILVGAFLLGMLWRFRGSHGWGSAWGVLSCGFVFVLFLTAVVGQKQRASFAMLSVTAFSFMLTTPSWGTFLSAMTGIQSLNAKDSDAVTQVFVHPASAAFLLLCLGFGMVAVFGMLLGKCFGGKTWRIRDFVLVVVTFYLVSMLMQATLSHVVFRLIQPESVRVFADDLQAKGITNGVYRTYLAHFGNIPWGKKFVGGRHYFASIEAISRAAAAAAELLVVRFVIRDKQAARTGAVVCAAFALAITAADLFFFFSEGGYHGAQGFALPEWIAVWSSWEYCTGFLAGGCITAYVRRLPITTEVVLPEKLRQKTRDIACFIIFWIGGVGINVVRPMLLRTEKTALQIPLVILAAIAALIAGILLARKYGWNFSGIASDSLACALVAFFAVYDLLLYLFAYEPQIHELSMLHNILVLLSFAVVMIWGIQTKRKSKLPQ